MPIYMLRRRPNARERSFRVRLAGALVPLLVVAACLASEGQETTIAASASPTPIALSTGRTTVRLHAVGERGVELRQPIATLVRDLLPGRQIYMTLLQVKAEDDPGVAYNVYLGLPDGVPPRGAADPHYLGTFSFFDATGKTGTAISINITRHLKRLLSRGDLGDDLQLTIAAAGKPDAVARPQIGSIQVIARK